VANSTLKRDVISAANGIERAPGGDSSHLQRALPLPWRLSASQDDPGFAHPAELDFARILTFYRIRWAYEPTTFALAWRGDGRPSEMFTPDFYLPDHRLYIELTTMRQSLVTRKNRKLRQMREIYPTVQIKLLYKRDIHRLADAYRIGDRRVSSNSVLNPLLSEELITKRIDELAAEIAGTSAELPLLILIANDGAMRFGREMAASLIERGVDIEVDQIRQTRFRTAGGIQRVRVHRQPHASVEGRRVLLLTDIVSTGMSLGYLMLWLKSRGAETIEICTLLDRRDARLIDLPIAYAGFEAPNDLIVGYGMPLQRQFADIPHLATITSEPRC
jgi:hypoxanthine phosphoribosyltransferase